MKDFILKNKDYILIVLFFSFFFSLIALPNDINSKVIIILVAFAIFFFSLSNLKTYIKNHYPLLILYAILVLSLLYSENTAMGLSKIERLSAIPVSLVVFSSLSFTKKLVVTILRSFVLIILLVTFYSHTITIINFIGNDETSIREFFKLNYSYRALGNTVNLHTTYYSFYILTAVIILIEHLKNARRFWEKLTCILIIAYFGFFILQLSSRISIVILFLLIVLNTIQYAYNRRRLLKGLGLLVLFSVVIYFALSNIAITKYRFQHILGFTYYTGYTVNDADHKMALWNAAIKANNSMLFGNGIGDIQASLNDSYRQYELDKLFENSYNSHNQYIEYYVTIGVVGLGIFVYLLLYYLRNFQRQKNNLGLQFVFIISILGITECIWNRHNGVVHICFMLGLLWALHHGGRTSSP